MINPHLNQPIVRKGQLISGHTPVIIGLHGRTQSPETIVEIFDRLAWPDAALIAPAAAGNTWYPARFMEPLEQNEPWLSHALERVHGLVRGLLEGGLPSEHIFLMGFLQGACLAAEYAMRHTMRYGGLLIFTGGVIGPDGTAWNSAGAFAGTPALLTTGDSDPWVPAGRVHETGELFRQKGAVVTVQEYAGREHLVSDAEIALARGLFVVSGASPV